jgi:hypothetical protein
VNRSSIQFPFRRTHLLAGYRPLMTNEDKGNLKQRFPADFVKLVSYTLAPVSIIEPSINTIARGSLSETSFARNERTVD